MTPTPERLVDPSAAPPAPWGGHPWAERPAGATPVPVPVHWSVPTPPAAAGRGRDGAFARGFLSGVLAMMLTMAASAALGMTVGDTMLAELNRMAERPGPARVLELISSLDPTDRAIPAPARTG